MSIRPPNSLSDLRLDGPQNVPLQGNILGWIGSRSQWIAPEFVADLSPPNTFFLVNHNLGHRPSAIRIIDSSGNSLRCQINEVIGNEANAFTITVRAAFSGKVFVG